MSTLVASSRPAPACGATSDAHASRTFGLAGLFAAIWAALERFGQARAARELQLQSDRLLPLDPERAAQFAQAAARCRRSMDRG